MSFARNVTANERNGVFAVLAYVVFDTIRHLPSWHWETLWLFGLGPLIGLGIGSLVDRLLARRSLVAGVFETLVAIVAAIAGGTLGAALSTGNLGVALAIGSFTTLMFYGFAVGLIRLPSLFM